MALNIKKALFGEEDVKEDETLEEEFYSVSEKNHKEDETKMVVR